VWKLGEATYGEKQVDTAAAEALARRLHQTIAKVGDDIEHVKFNTAIAALMSLRNELLQVLRAGTVPATAWDTAVETLLLLLAPVAPHVTEELWNRRGHRQSIHLARWPEADPEIARDQVVVMVVQVNGKVRDRIEVDPSIGEDEAVAAALASNRVAPYLDGGEPRTVITRLPNLVNVVV
ncbi:MAG: class I tRNA ligase family protein, partial [Actinomycetota bacterium]|nr:class I tRNA ligase family protein [Actinomycetota bacterium]